MRPRAFAPVRLNAQTRTPNFVFYRSHPSSTPIGHILPPMAVFTSKCRCERSSTTLGSVLSLGAIEHSFFWTFMAIGRILYCTDVHLSKDGMVGPERRGDGQVAST
jgi:hypothetical protein